MEVAYIPSRQLYGAMDPFASRICRRYTLLPEPLEARYTSRHGQGVPGCHHTSVRIPRVRGLLADNM